MVWHTCTNGRRTPAAPGARRAGAAIASIAAGVLLVGSILAAPALAQDSVESLSERVDRLQRELANMQFQLFSGERSTSSGGVALPSPGGGGGDVAAAQMSVRMAELENSLQQVTGQLEQTGFRINQLSQQVQQIQESLGQRLGEMDKAIADLRKEVRSRPAPSPAGGSGSLGQMPAEAGGDVVAAADPVGEVEAAEPEEPPIDPRAVLPEGTAQQQYNHAFRLLRQGDYTEAERSLKAFLQLHPETDLSANAMYWLGETHYVRNDYVTAAQIFSETYQKYPRGAKAPDSLLKLGMALNNLGEQGTACTTFQELTRRFPNAPSNIKLLADRERQKAGCT